MEKLVPYAQWDAVRDGIQPYFRTKEFRKVVLYKDKPCTWKGSAVSQLEAAFSYAKVTSVWRVGVSFENSSLEKVDKFMALDCLTSNLCELKPQRMSAERL